MRENWCLLVAAAIVAAALLGGCATGEANGPGRIRRPGNSNIIFNPDFTTPVVVGAERGNWPAVVADDGHGADVAYRETVIDRHGLNNRSRDYYSRRVESTRIRHHQR